MEYNIKVSTKKLLIDSLRISIPIALINMTVFNLIHYNTIAMTILNSYILIHFTVMLTVNVIRVKKSFNIRSDN